MKRGWLIVLLWFFTGCMPKTPQEALKRIDEKIYYPQVHGLNTLFCEVESPYIPEMFRRIEEGYPAAKSILDQIKVEGRFYWKQGKGGRYVIKGIPENLSPLRQSVLNIFKGTEIVVIPPLEQEQFKDLLVSLKRQEGRLEIMGINPDSSSSLREYDLIVSRWSLKPLERRFYGEGLLSTSQLCYQRWRGKFYLVKIDTLQDYEKTPDVKDLVELEYQEVEGFWLLKKMAHQAELVEGSKKLFGPVEVLFKNCRVNAPVPERIFQGAEVQFLD